MVRTVVYYVKETFRQWQRSWSVLSFLRASDRGNYHQNCIDCLGNADVNQVIVLLKGIQKKEQKHERFFINFSQLGRWNMTSMSLTVLKQHLTSLHIGNVISYTSTWRAEASYQLEVSLQEIDWLERKDVTCRRWLQICIGFSICCSTLWHYLYYAGFQWNLLLLDNLHFKHHYGCTLRQYVFVY